MQHLIASVLLAVSFGAVSLPALAGQTPDAPEAWNDGNLPCNGQICVIPH